MIENRFAMERLKAKAEYETQATAAEEARRRAEWDRQQRITQEGKIALKGIPPAAAPQKPTIVEVRNPDTGKLEKQEIYYEKGRAKLGKTIGETVGKLSPLGKLIEERDKYPEGDPKRDFYSQRIAKLVQTTGMKITLPDGTIIDTNAAQGTLTKKTQGEIEEKLMAGHEQYARISEIISGFKPEYQEVGYRWGQTITGLKARLGRDISPEDAQELAGFKSYQRTAIENINLYIKEMTGAQMSEKEANRLRLAQPDPGEKWYTGDDPITFKAKADNVIKSVRAVIARYEYYRSKGFPHKKIKNLINTGKAISLGTITNAME
jgi:hypothetical protein